MSGRDDDLSLVAACRAGDREAFGELVRRYQDRLYPTALRLTGRSEDALDLLQEAFLRAYRKLAQFHGHSSFYTWLYRLMVNLALSNRRRRRLANGRPYEATSNLDLAADPDLSDPAAPLERAERDRQVQLALNALAPDHRAVLVMKDLDGMRYEEIAGTLGVPVGTVRSRLHRARGELRDRLRGLMETEPARERVE
jgi:RNA polymerase sigma-70 factor (ECF subfamily)